MMFFLPFQNNHNNLDPSSKMDLDFEIVLEGKSPFPKQVPESRSVIQDGSRLLELFCRGKPCLITKS